MSLSNLATGLRPGVCTSTTRPGSPYTGQIIYETDTGYLRVWDGAAWDYFLPKQDGIPGAWTTFTPTFKFSTTAAATSSTDGLYTIIGKLLILQAGFVSSGSQTSGSWSFTLPDSLAISEGRDNQRIGTVYLYDASPNTQYGGIPYVSGSDGTTVLGFEKSGSGAAIGNTAPMTWAVNDECDLSITARLV
jgi:hypothetical protein